MFLTNTIYIPNAQFDKENPANKSISQAHINLRTIVLQLLRSKVNDLRAADKQVDSENKAFNDENGDGADISGILMFCCIISQVLSNFSF